LRVDSPNNCDLKREVQSWFLSFCRSRRRNTLCDAIRMSQEHAVEKETNLLCRARGGRLMGALRCDSFRHALEWGAWARGPALLIRPWRTR
jgi:hypothetical protein